MYCSSCFRLPATFVKRKIRRRSGHSRLSRKKLRRSRHWSVSQVDVLGGKYWTFPFVAPKGILHFYDFAFRKACEKRGSGLDTSQDCVFPKWHKKKIKIKKTNKQRISIAASVSVGNCRCPFVSLSVRSPTFIRDYFLLSSSFSGEFQLLSRISPTDQNRFGSEQNYSSSFRPGTKK